MIIKTASPSQLLDDSDSSKNIHRMSSRSLTIKKSNDEGCHFKELTARYIESMQEDSKVLNIIPPTFQPKATEAISSMIKMISILLEKSFAYVGNNGDVFFEISKFKFETLESILKKTGEMMRTKISFPSKMKFLKVIFNIIF